MIQCTTQFGPLEQENRFEVHGPQLGLAAAMCRAKCHAEAGAHGAAIMNGHADVTTGIRT
jgi:hypothetical protein|eukprot:CAMPEP_0174299256 /NCGR_PEP_ID=MMETSP0809-20121228/56175_1 /TAXON_ID=73025 ORGANISM="Eutreptiella gymnastica-like, Strain CCMP1594" /NCGR_SAMPLE_ID=MMETSP0809 /ASSEMBLY_ACC=CAM_ASM_000658 /LENGTH=59 /DNA_ID=CAMNT_0015404291 /DNA_START=597 /DNA_END=776 /DNA_ORIENTATION=-